jgi:hypothetical protein
MVMYFRKPLFSDVLKRSWRGDGEADEEDIGLGVGKWTQAIVIFLTRSIEETQGVRFIADPVRQGSVPCPREKVFQVKIKRAPQSDSRESDFKVTSFVTGKGNLRPRGRMTSRHSLVWGGGSEIDRWDLHHRHRIVVKHCRNIFGGELVRCV